MADTDLFDFTGASAPVIRGAPMGAAGDVAHTAVAVQGALVPVAQIGGLVAGEVAWAAYHVDLAQLRPASGGIVNLTYDAKLDYAGRAPLRESLRQFKGNRDPLICRPTGETVQVQGQEKPLLEVCLGLREYWALVDLQMSQALIRLWDVDMGQEAEQLMFGLARDALHHPLPILDTCDVLRILHRVHGLKQHVIAARTGYRQDEVSRRIQLSEQPTLIRTYLANGSLSAEHVRMLAEKVKDERLRVLAARYSVQEVLTVPALRDRCNLLCPPDGAAPMLILHETEAGEIDAEDKLHGPAIKLTAPPAWRPYWKQGRPMAASPFRIQHEAERRRVELTPTTGGVLVGVDGLGVRALLKRLDSQRVRDIPLADFEEAVLADLEALRAELDREHLLTDRGVVRAAAVVDADPDPADARDARDADAAGRSHVG